MAENLEGAEADDFRALCMAIGFVVVNWSVIEQQVDNWVNVTFINCGGNALRKNGDIPRSFKMKADYLKKCFKNLDVLKPFAIEGLNLLGRVSNISENPGGSEQGAAHRAEKLMVPLDPSHLMVEAGYSALKAACLTDDPLEADRETVAEIYRTMIAQLRRPSASAMRF
jgi:hypothetical protein